MQEITVTLVDELDQLATTRTNSRDRGNAQLPTLPQLYRIGGVLAHLDSSDIQNQEIASVRDAYQQLALSLPRSYFGRCFNLIQKAMQTLTNRVASATTSAVSSTSNKDIEALFEAVQSLAGLLAHSPRACQIAYSTELVSTLASIHDQTLRLASLSPPSEELQKSQRAILRCLSNLFVDGWLSTALEESDKTQGQQEPIEQQVMHALQAMEEQSTDTLSHLLEWQEQWESPKRQFEHSLREKYNSINGAGSERDSTQLDYVIQMLETAREDRQRQQQVSVDQPKSSQQKNNTASIPSKPVSAADELDRRIDQVQQVLPDLGAGFIEAALSYYRGDIETTVSMLLAGGESDLPPALRVIDRKLPRRQKQSNRSKDDAASAAEAKQIVKDRVALEQQHEEEKYKALLYVSQEDKQQQNQSDLVAAAVTHAEMMYDDDYDDQYDDVDGGLGGADSGWYDFEKVKLYNQAIKDEEADQLYWEQNRNTNRPANTNGSGDNRKDAPQGEDQGKQYRGPDKIKGGRIIGPDGKVVKNAGGRGRKQQQQQRQANNNNSNNASGGQGGTGGTSQQQTKKPKTKPKSNNRVNQRRDKKQKAQGSFGINE